MFSRAKGPEFPGGTQQASALPGAAGRGPGSEVSPSTPGRRKPIPGQTAGAHRHGPRALRQLRLSQQRGLGVDTASAKPDGAAANFPVNPDVCLSRMKTQKRGLGPRGCESCVVSRLWRGTGKLRGGIVDNSQGSGRDMVQPGPGRLAGDTLHGFRERERGATGANTASRSPAPEEGGSVGPWEERRVWAM